jgi:hypothetical protein
MITLKRHKLHLRIITSFLLVSFLSISIFPPSITAQVIPALPGLPAVGSMLNISAGFRPAVLQGIIVNPKDPFQLDFIVDTGDSKLSGAELEAEVSKLVKYFLAALTTPEEEMWVNLSPYEGDRIVPDSFGVTEMGRDLLAQDYLLKQLTASLMYPDDKTGDKFWRNVYQKANQQFGTTQLPFNTFNKVWILPKSAYVFEQNNKALLLDSQLKVMLEQDYVSLRENLSDAKFGMTNQSADETQEINTMTSALVRELLIPEIEKEVNGGENFVNLRQIYASMILAHWYKKRLKNSVLAQVYADQNKVVGVDIDDKTIKDKIYAQYIEAFKKGVYNYIKEEVDPVTQELTPRKYYSGGFGTGINKATGAGGLGEVVQTGSSPMQIPAEFKSKLNPVSSSTVVASTQITAIPESSNPVQTTETTVAVPSLETVLWRIVQLEKLIGISISGDASVSIGPVNVFDSKDNKFQILKDVLRQAKYLSPKRTITVYFQNEKGFYYPTGKVRIELKLGKLQEAQNAKFFDWLPSIREKVLKESATSQVFGLIQGGETVLQIDLPVASSPIDSDSLENSSPRGMIADIENGVEANDRSRLNKLVQLAQNPSVEVQAALVRAFEHFGGAESIQGLIDILTGKQSDTRVRMLAARALGEIAPKDRDAERVLLNTLETESWTELRWAIIVALGKIGQEDSIKTLDTLKDSDKDPDNRAQINKSIDSIRARLSSASSPIDENEPPSDFLLGADIKIKRPDQLNTDLQKQLQQQELSGFSATFVATRDDKIIGSIHHRVMLGDSEDTALIQVDDVWVKNENERSRIMRMFWDSIKSEAGLYEINQVVISNVRNNAQGQLWYELLKPSMSNGVSARFTTKEFDGRLTLTAELNNANNNSDKTASSPVNNKETSVQPPGGIDFNPRWLEMEIRRDGNGVPLPIESQPIEQFRMQIQGVIPVIINITPVTNLPMLLGIATPDLPKQQTETDLTRGLYTRDPQDLLVSRN